MYSPDTPDHERTSWCIVVYFNIACFVKRILETLESHDDKFDESVSESPVLDSVSPKRTLEVIHRDVVEDPSTSHPYSTSVVTESQKDIATLRLRLSSLVAAEATLADRLSHDIRISGSGQGSVYARHDRQFRSSAHNSSSTNPSRGTTGALSSPILEGGNNVNIEIVERVRKILGASKEDVKALWRSDVVQKMINRRRLRLEEGAELYVSVCAHAEVRYHL